MEFKKISDVSSLRNENVKNNEDENLIYLTTADFISEKQGIKEDLRDSINRSGKKFYKNDILISNIRPYFKKIWHANRDGITSNDVLIIKNDNNIENKYLYYVLSQDEFFEYATKTSKGTKMPRGDKKAIRKFEFYMPTRKEQIRAIRLLEQMEKKIEINNKIIQNLEDQAQALFKYYFVDFGPFKDWDFIDSEIGKIPKGWEVVSLGKSDISKLIKSGIKKFGGEKTYLATADISNTKIINSETKVNYKNRPSRANMQPVESSIWFAKMKDSRKLIFVSEIDNILMDKFILSTGFAGIKTSKISFPYIASYILTDEFDSIKNLYSQGTTMQAINNKNIKNIKIAKPTDKILENYYELTYDIFKLMSRLNSQNDNLAQIRDSLLPRLMNGEIDLSNIELKED